MKKQFLFILASAILVTCLFSIIPQTQAATSNQTNFSVDTGFSTTYPQLVVEALQYEPYPVNPGQWFDLWVKVQNTGQNDAPNVEFNLLTDKVFENVDSPTKDFGLIAGTNNAYKYQRQLGDTQIEANQIIMKFRVKVADNAPEGQSILNLQMTTNNNSVLNSQYQIPIEIAKTRTDFSLITQQSSSQGTSFAIANTGENPASAVIVSIPDQEGVRISGPKSSIIGNLNTGDFTSVTFQILPQNGVKTIKMDVAYTDTANVRTVEEENVSIDMGVPFNSTRIGGTGTFSRTSTSSSSSTFNFSTLMYIILGAVIGVGVMVVRRKMKGAKHENK